MVVSDTYAFPGFLKPVLTQLSFQSQQLFFLPCKRSNRKKCMVMMMMMMVVIIVMMIDQKHYVLDSHTKLFFYSN